MFALSCLLLVASCHSGTEDTSTSSTAWQSVAISTLEAGHCDDFWKMIHPYAKQGNPDAAALIAGAIYSHGFVPPGVNDDALFRFRALMSGFSLSAKSGEPRSLEMLLALSEANIFPNDGGKEFSQCLVAEENKYKCINKAIQDKLFPSFEQWFKEIDSLRNPGSKAVCNEPSNSQKLNDDDFDVVPALDN
ncbi:hypothetical protein M3P05_20235 [Sansalvadorimonas sp. 2012CJ34-2]|uniref:Lipoprotein n=1 Tax=Parendozoicomonas callyspongiae TaxID=2942213 RepID=A0ABT0PLK8_9GAMM|nr:hypothetical protein [Sansalvadorimonas sp. 2012CJ34-2]MCL6272253.1 hypothetical protein [Sansalvadorimonas sp. 2012CJ34-2]